MSLSWLRYARLLTWKEGAIGRTFSTSSSQRDVIQAQGQSGSNHKSTRVGSVLVSVAVNGAPMVEATGGVRACALQGTVPSDSVIPRAEWDNASHAWNQPD